MSEIGSKMAALKVTNLFVIAGKYINYDSEHYYLNNQKQTRETNLIPVIFNESMNYYVFHDRLTLFFANNSLTQCQITMKFLHNLF